MKDNTQAIEKDDRLDSRDIIDRIEYLSDNRDDLDEDERSELHDLEKLADEAEEYAADWKHGETLIRDDHFEEYARELAEDIGAIKNGMGWPYTCIDWAEAARELQQDYTSVDFGGTTYWIR